MTRTGLFMGAALAALCAAGGVNAQTEAAADASQAVATNSVEEVVVFGHGQTRQTQRLVAKDIQRLAPGSSPLKAIAKLPGVNFQSADPFGAYEWSARISIRGFDQNHLGFTLDDVPLGDMSYGNVNGLHISRAISSENIGVTDIAQGTGGLDTASTSNLGGTLQFKSLDPSHDFHVLTSATYGSENTTHAFVRLETGDLPLGGRGYISYGWQHADKWKGDGTQKQQQVNAKFVQPLSPTATFTGFVDYSDRRENDYQDMSLDLIRRNGYKWDNNSKDWTGAVQAANVYQANPGGDCPQVGGGDGSNSFDPSDPDNTGNYPSGFQCIDDAYYNAAGLRKDTIGAGKLDWEIVPGLNLKLVGYGHHNEGQGIWYTPYVPTPGGAPISIRTTEYSMDRGGAIGSLSYTFHGNTLEGGWWHEDNAFEQARRYYGLDDSGRNRSSLSFQNDPFRTDWDYKFHTRTDVYHVQDTLQVTHDLKINAGFKGEDVAIRSVAVAGSAFDGKIESKKAFLPQAGINWTVGGNGELFADYARNMRAYVGAASAGPFSGGPTSFPSVKDTLKPETSDTGEVGYRLHYGPVQAVVAGYYAKFKNRQLSISQCSGIIGCYSGLANVGGVTSKGVEVAGTWNIGWGLSLFGSYAYDDSQYDDDVVSTNSAGVTTTVHTDGKTTVDTPKHIANASLNYDNGTVFGGVDVAYQSRRYYTYTNDASVKGRTLVDLSLGFRLHGPGLLDGVEVQGNVTNLFDKKYVSTIGSNGFINSDPNGVFQTLLPGSPREGFVTLRKRF